MAALERWLREQDAARPDAPGQTYPYGTCPAGARAVERHLLGTALAWIEVDRDRTS